MTTLQFNNLSRLKNRSRSLPSSLRPCQRNRRRSGTIDPLIKEKRSRCLNLSASTLSTSWPTFRPETPSMSSSNCLNQLEKLSEKRWLTPKSSSLSSPLALPLTSRTAERLLCSNRYRLHPRGHASSGQTCPTPILYGIYRLQ